MIRPATLADLESILDIAKIETQHYPRLKRDEQKMRKVLIQIISSANHFCWVSENENVTGAIVAITNNNLWAQRQSSNIVLWVAEIAGDGKRLLRTFKTWVRSRRAIKVAGFAPDLNDLDERVWLLVKRLGFKRYGGAYLLYN